MAIAQRRRKSVRTRATHTVRARAVGSTAEYTSVHSRSAVARALPHAQLIVNENKYGTVQYSTVPVPVPVPDR